jgi:hypothetical protein
MKIEPIRGCYIYEYAQVLNLNVFIMRPECCIGYDPRMWDDTPLTRNLVTACYTLSSGRKR